MGEPPLLRELREDGVQEGEGLVHVKSVKIHHPLPMMATVDNGRHRRNDQGGGVKSTDGLQHAWRPLLDFMTLPTGPLVSYFSIEPFVGAISGGEDGHGGLLMLFPHAGIQLTTWATHREPMQAYSKGRGVSWRQGRQSTGVVSVRQG